jgi:hypothetical protein
MGVFGFVFDCGGIFVAVCTEHQFSHDILIGLEKSLPMISKYFWYDSKTSSLQPYVRLKNEQNSYSKISLSDSTIVDFSHSMFWYSLKEYSAIQQLLNEDITLDTLGFYFEECLSLSKVKPYL